MGRNSECPLCGATGNTLRLQSMDERDFTYCEVCKLIYIDNSFLPDVPHERERYEQHDNVPENAGYVKFLSRVLDPLLPYMSNGAICLDHGCGPGPVLAELVRAEGFTCWAYDPIFYPDGLAEAAAELGSSEKKIPSSLNSTQSEEDNSEIDQRSESTKIHDSEEGKRVGVSPSVMGGNLDSEVKNVIAKRGQSEFPNPSFNADSKSGSGTGKVLDPIDTLSEAFHVVFSTECFEHFHQPAQTISEIVGMVKKGGYLGVMTEMWTDLDRFSSWYYTRDDTHVIFFHEQTFDWLCGEYGLRRVWSDGKRVMIFQKLG